MSKLEGAPEQRQEVSGVKSVELGVDIEKRVLTQEELNEFVEFVKQEKAKNPDVSISLVDYVTEKYYQGRGDVVVVPDISGLKVGKALEYPEEVRGQQGEEFVESLKENHLDLAGVDFSGAVLKGTKFTGCDISDGVFCDTDLGGVEFNDCYLQGADLRGADLSKVTFNEDEPDLDEILVDMKPVETADLLESQNLQRYGKMKLSTVEPLLSQYAELNEERLEQAKEKFEQDKQRKLDVQQERLDENEEKLRLMKEKVDAAYGKVSYYQRARGGEDYDKYKELYDEQQSLIAELNPQIESIKQKIAKIQETKLDESQVKYVMDRSVTELPEIMSDDYQMSYDPAYKRGSSKEERNQERHYVRLTREDTQEYLALVEDKPDLSINEFAAQKLKERGGSLKKGEVPIADVSTQIVKFEVTKEDAQEFQRLRRDNEDLTVKEFIADKMRARGVPEIQSAAIIGKLNPNILNPNNEFDPLVPKKWPQTLSLQMQTDLSELDFSRCNLQGACFSGANLSGAKFDGANLSNATFEGANLQEAEFIGATARDANFHAADLTDAVVRESDFTRAYLPFSFGERAQVEKSNFRFADIRNGQWQDVRIEGSDLSYANMEGVVLANADIRRTKMVCANLERAILDGCQLVESDLSGAFLKEAEMRKAKIKGTSLQNARAGKIDLSESEIDEFSKLDGAELKEAIMRKVKADKVSFVRANMEEANLEYAQMKGAIVEGANMRFGELHGAVMDGVKGSKVDLTGADLTDVQARGADFREAQLENIKGMRADFSEAVLENAELRAARLEKAIMRKVNARKADLRDADMQGVDFSGADVEEALVNDNSDMHKAKIEGVKGELVKENLDGSKEKISVEQQRENSAQIHDARSKGTLSRIGGKILGAMGNGLKKVGEFIKQPLSTKWGRIIGGVVGALAVAAVVASVVFTAGLSLPVIAAAVGGALLVGGAAGAVGGHFVAKHSGLSTLAMGAAGAVMLPVAPGLGAAAGLAGGAVVNGVAKKVIGQSIDEAVGNGVIAVGEQAKKGEKYFGVSEEQVRLEQAQKQCAEQYKAPERDKSKKAEVGGPSFEEVQRQQMKQHGLGSEPERDKSPVKKTALQSEVGQIVEKMESTKTRPRSQSVPEKEKPKKVTKRQSMEI